MAATSQIYPPRVSSSPIPSTHVWFVQTKTSSNHVLQRGYQKDSPDSPTLSWAWRWYLPRSFLDQAKHFEDVTLVSLPTTLLLLSRVISSIRPYTSSPVPTIPHPKSWVSEWDSKFFHWLRPYKGLFTESTFWYKNPKSLVHRNLFIEFFSTRQFLPIGGLSKEYFVLAKSEPQTCLGFRDNHFKYWEVCIEAVRSLWTRTATIWN